MRHAQPRPENVETRDFEVGRLDVERVIPSKSGLSVRLSPRTTFQDIKTHQNWHVELQTQVFATLRLPHSTLRSFWRTNLS